MNNEAFTKKQSNKTFIKLLNRFLARIIVWMSEKIKYLFTTLKNRDP